MTARDNLPTLSRQPDDRALEGGSLHGAFASGSLDRVLNERSVAIAWFIGTCAAAVNAVAPRSGLTHKALTWGRGQPWN